MARILGIDYGHKKTGLAVTDPLQIIVNPLTTVATNELYDFLSGYIDKEDVEMIVVGEPLHADGSQSANHKQVMHFVEKLGQEYPNIKIELQDEYLSSKKAKEIIIQTVNSKKKRRDKSLVDRISATLILQTYLKHI